MTAKILSNSFFDRDAQQVAKSLLGKVIRVRQQGMLLSAMVIETEAYYLTDKGSHASLGYTEKRKALFMPAGTIYMYYARGGDSLNISCQGEGNACLIKSAKPYYEDEKLAAPMLEVMHRFNPAVSGGLRHPERLCSGQTLLCKSLGLKVPEWDAKTFDLERFYVEDVGYRPEKIIQTTRLGIPKGRDEHLMYRFVDLLYAPFCTDNPLKKRAWQEGKEYSILNQ
jgi:DNA-3-methyladenine glycosylase